MAFKNTSPLRPPAKVDENSLAVKILRRHQFFSDSLDGMTNIEGHKARAREASLTFDQYVRAMQLDTTKNRDEEASIAASMYGDNSLSAWLKYQQTYVIRKGLLDEASEELQKPFSLKQIQLPFPAVFVVIEYPDTEYNRGHSMSFLIYQRGQRFDVSTFVDDNNFYFPLDEDVLGIMASSDACYPDKLTEYCMYMAWYVILFLSIYRKKPNLITVRKIRVGGVTPKAKRVPSEWHILDEHILKELVPDADAPLDAALKPIGLIPPSERPEEIVHASNTHKPPKEHWVKEHTCTYWTGKGRKIPVVKTIKPFKRGKPSSDAPGTTRVYE